MNQLSSIQAFVTKQPKFKLVVTSAMDGLNYINVGRILSEYIVDKLSNSDIAQAAMEYMRDYMRTHTAYHPELGEYIALTNIAILQEPALKMDVVYLITELSKSHLLFINTADADLDLAQVPHLAL